MTSAEDPDRPARRRADPTNAFLRIRYADVELAPACIFDIGANVGQTVAQIRDAYPDVPVHAFEPVAATFATLQAATADDPATTVHRLALGARAGMATMTARPGGVQNRIIQAGAHTGGAPQEQVEVTAGDAFCDRRGISRIGILKVDAEGHDLDVLVGFRGLLAERRIDWVVVECGVSPRNRQHVPLHRLSDFLFAMGYGLFGLFPAETRRQIRRAPGAAPHGLGLWYANAIFVAEPWPEAAARS
jgi:FkbM family methyltransferase